MADDEDDALITEAFRNKRLEDAKEKLNTMRDTQTPEYVEQSSGGSTVMGGIPSSHGAAMTELWKTAVEAPLQGLVGGPRDAIQNTINTLDDLAWGLDNFMGGPEWRASHDVSEIERTISDSYRENLIAETKEEIPEAEGEADPQESVREGSQLPEVPQPTSAGGQAVRSISQFITGFVPALRGIQAISGGARAVGSLGGLAQTEAAATIADAVAFDPHEERLSNMIESVPALQNPVTDFLAAEEDDTAAEGRFKNALEGMGLGAVVNLMSSGLRAVRANRVEKGLRPDEPVGQEVQIFNRLGDPEAPIVRPAEESDLPFKMNWAKYLGDDDIEAAVRQTAKMYTDRIDEARRGTITEEELQGLADDLGVTSEQVLNGSFKGSAYRAEEILAMRDILKQSTQDTMSAAARAWQSTDAEDLFTFRKMMDINLAIQSKFQGAASEAGRSLRALQIPSGSREKQIMELENQLMKDQTPEEIRQLAFAVSQVDDPSTVRRAMRASLGKRTADATTEVWYFDLLSGPITHTVNISTSALNTVWQIPERAIAAGYRRMFDPDANGVQAGEAMQMLYGFVESIPDAVRMAGKVARTGEPGDVFQKVEVRSPRAITSEKFPVGESVEKLISNFHPTAGRALGQAFAKGIDGFGFVTSLTRRALMAEDSFFLTLGKTMETRAQAFRIASREGLEGEAMAQRMQEIVRNPTESVRAEAEQFARSLSFNQPLGRDGERFIQTMNRHPITKIFLPFIRTPTNLMKWAGTRSPLTFAAESVRNDIKRGGASADKALARFTAGSMLGLMGVDLAQKGLVTGAGPSDSELRQVWLRDKQPFSIKFGDTWYTYNRFAPFGILVAASASYAEIASEASEKDLGEIATAVATATSRSVLSQSWLVGPNEFLEALLDPQRNFEEYFAKTAGTFLVPTGSAHVTRAVDPVWRDVNNLIDAVKSRTPGFSDDLPARRNLWGQPIKPDGAVGPEWMSPILKYGEEDRPIDEWMYENKVTIDMPARSRDGVELTPKQYSRFTQLQGNESKDPMTGLGFYDTMNALVEGNHPQSAAWERQTDGPKGGKSRILRRWLSYFRTLATEQLRQEDADFAGRARAVDHENVRALRETIMNPSAGEAE